MPAFVIVEIEVRDPEAYEGYKSLVPASLEAYGSGVVELTGIPRRESHPDARGTNPNDRHRRSLGARGSGDVVE